MTRPTVLAVDIGNTTTSIGLFVGARLQQHVSMATQPLRTPDEVMTQLQALITTRRLTITRRTPVIICSVVPRMTAVLTQALEMIGVGSLRVVGQHLQVPLKNQYTYPEQVGQDRLVGAYAALRQYRSDCIVADFGTAITIDLVKKSGTYLGGIIAPGLDLSLDALATRTALLPTIELREPPELLGRDTANSIRSGVLFGAIALCDGLVSSMKRRYAPKATVIATGGFSPLIAKHATTIAHVRPHLVLEGLFLLAQ